MRIQDAPVAVVLVVLVVLVVVLAIILGCIDRIVRFCCIHSVAAPMSPMVGGRGKLKNALAYESPMETRISTTITFETSRLLFGAVKHFPETKKRVIKFIRSKMPQTTSAAAIQTVCGSGASDLVILRKLRGLYESAQVHTKPATQTKSIPSPIVKSREKSRVEDIEAEIALFGSRVTPDFKYLDVGSSEGKITGAIASTLDLAKTQAYACDIIEPATKDDRFTFVRNTAAKLPFDDAAFNVITMFMSAHHFFDTGAMLDECKRVARPGTLVLIREHDCRTPAAGAFYDIAHALYACVLGTEASPEEFLAQYAAGTYACYRSCAEWIQIFAAHGFVLSDKVPPHASRFGVDSFDSFYALFEVAPQK
jgi:SAM-dependent methyltransferase